MHPPRTPPDATAPPEMRAAAVLDLLPVPVAVRGAEGYVYRNAAHRALAAEALDAGGTGDGGDLEALGLTQVTDPVSGHVYLRTRTPLGDGPDLLEVLEDITGRHLDRDEIARQRDALARDAEALARANRELAVIDRAKAAFIALAAHELRTPLTALGNALALLRRAPAGDGGGGGRFLAMAERNVGRLAALADDLLAFTKLEVGHLALAVAPVDLEALVAEAAADPEAGPERVRVTGAGRLPAVHGDPAGLAQVVRGLLAHALEKAPEGHAVRVALAHRRRWPRAADPADPARAPEAPGAPEGWIEVAVAGPAEAGGEPPGAMADGDEALGLGLAVGRRIAALHGGALWARRGPGGRAVVLRLPVLSPADARLLPVQEAWRRLPAHGAPPALVVLRLAEGGDPEALRGAFGVDPGFASVPETGEVVGAVTGPAAVERARRAAARWSAARGCPIRMGWSRADAAADFRAALARARAAARPLGGSGGRDGGEEGEEG